MSKIEDKCIENLILKLDAALENKEMDLSRIMDEALKIVVLLMRASAKADKTYALDREVELWVRVNEVKGTFCSKTVLALTITAGTLTILSGFAGLGAALPGTNLGNTLASKGLTLLSGANAAKNMKMVSHSIGQLGQGVGFFPKISEDISQSERTVANAWLEETKQKRQDRIDSRQRNTSQQDKAIQQARELDQKKSQVFSEFTRPGS